ncbi:hypothetical protein HJC23_005122 [Cyclotella cryptica]|uniref:Uncharacterized protein n=1 Tax=Cyclotella cryptica TaxID=29204 RepID=A0ABD3QEW4_9STRA|eukprot:CCRYP_005806-RA/>CCRYP_005806-RA protein AED:0.26 eAED:0.26 QI:0/-1/0/1/-1/1/1/0/891
MRDAENKGSQALTVRDPDSEHDTSRERFDMEGGAGPPRPELLHDSDGGPPLDSAAATMTMFEKTKGADGKRRPAGLELIGGTDSHMGPTVRFEEKFSRKMMDEERRAETNNSHLSLDDGSSTSAPEDHDGSLQCTAVINPRFMNYQSGGGDGTRSITTAVGSSSGVSSGGTIDASTSTGNQTIVTATTVATTQDGTIPMQHDTSVRGIAEAYLVDDELIFATPAKPWWKQRRTMLLLALVISAIVVAIALGIILSSGDTTTTVQLNGIVSPSPSISVSPTSTMIPSSSPTNCADIIASSAQRITLLNPNPRFVSTAIDGRNLLVASIWNSDSTVSRSFYVEFYSLEDGSWERIGHFIKGDIDWRIDQFFDLYFNTAISGKTAVVGVPSGGNFVDDWSKSGEIFVYKQNSFGLWEEVDPPLPSNRTGYCSFGESVDIDGTLLVVTDEWECNAMASSNAAYIFRQDGNKWNEIQALHREGSASIGLIAVTGNTIAVADGFSDMMPFIDIYAVDQSVNNVTHTQRIEPVVRSILFLSLEGNRLLSVVTTDREDATYEQTMMVYAKEDATKRFTLIQSLNTSLYGDGTIGQNFAFDGNLLVIEGYNSTHIFSWQLDGTLVETLTLDQSYNRYQLSENSLIGVTDNVVHSMSFEGCMNDMPTGAPSVSESSHTCEWVNVTFSCNPDRRLQVYSIDTACIVLSEDLPYYGFWEARIETREFLEIDAEIVATYKKPDDAPALDVYNGLDHQYSVEYSDCIYPGQYQFVFRAESSGNAQPYYIHYRVETNGKLIAQEQVSLEPYRDEIDKRHEFSIPFDPSEGNFPTGGPLTPKPTMSPNTPYPTWSASNSTTWRPTSFKIMPVPTARPANFTPVLTAMPGNSLQPSTSPELILPALDE